MQRRRPARGLAKRTAAAAAAFDLGGGKRRRRVEGHTQVKPPSLAVVASTFLPTLSLQ